MVVETRTLVVEKGTCVVQRGTFVAVVWWLWTVDFESGKNVKEQFLLFVSRVSDAHWRATKEQRPSPMSGENSLTWKLWAWQRQPQNAKFGVYT